MEEDKKDEKQKQPYEAPALRVVTLEVKTSVLATCSLSVGVSPLYGSCRTFAGRCFGGN
jgi:hypothetical protein